MQETLLFEYRRHSQCQHDSALLCGFSFRGSPVNGPKCATCHRGARVSLRRRLGMIVIEAKRGAISRRASGGPPPRLHPHRGCGRQERENA